MSGRRILYVIGAVVMAVGVAMLSATVVALIYQEWAEAWQITLAAVVTFAIGGAAWRYFDRPGELTTREGFATVGLAWFAISAFGMLPYLFTGTFWLTNAFFETAAGFTTTGASVLAAPEELPHALLFWRSLTQWMGGMGIIVLSVAILPLLGVGGVQLARAESPGPQPDRLTPRFQETAKRLWLAYVVITGLEAALLFLGDMNLFDAINHALTTMSTGGFGTKSASIAAFSAYSQWVVIVFMLVAGASFTLHIRALRDPKVYQRDAEFRLYMSIMVAAATVILIGTWGGSALDTTRDAIFQTVSIVTTTGFATADFAQWSAALQILMVGLMFVGGMAGSTSGSVKVYRHAVLFKASRADLRRLIHPRGVFVTRFADREVPDPVVESVQSFFLLYMFLFMTGTLAFGIIESISGSGFDLASSASAVASSIGNVGPGLGAVGPTENYEAVPAVGKWLLSFLMIVGRLEIFPVLLLFTRELWRR